MSDQRITQLTKLNQADVAANDVLAIVDVGSSITKKVEAKELFQAGAALADNASIDLVKLNQASTTKLGTAALADDAVTAAKLGNDSAIAYDSVAPTIDNFEGRGYVNTTNKNLQVWDGGAFQQVVAPTAGIADLAVTTGKLADGAVTTAKVTALGTTAYADTSITTAKIADAAITGAKILDGEITTAKVGASGLAAAAIASDAITTAKVLDGAITAAKLAADSTTIVQAGTPTGSGAYEGQQWFDTNTSVKYVWDSTAWVRQAAINALTFTDSTPVNFAVAYPDSHSAIITTTLDTQVANRAFVGPATGADAAPTFRALVPADLPDATASTKGIIQPGTGLAVNAGTLNHSNSVAAGTYTKLTVDAQGHVSTGALLEATDIPGIDAAKITTGELPTERLADNAVTIDKLSDYSTASLGEVFPTPSFIGQIHLNPLDKSFFMWDGNVFVPIGISAGQIIFAGTFDASTGGGVGAIASLTPEGVAAGFSIGALPASSATNNKHYFVVSEGGTITSGNAPNVTLAPPDLILSVYNTSSPGWVEIDVSAGAGSISANQVSFTPAGDLGSTSVQAAIEEVSTECRNATNLTSGTLAVARGGTNLASYTKGDIIVASGATTLVKLPVGTNGQVLTADSTETSGLKYTTPTVGTVTDVTSSTTALTIATSTTTPALTIRAATTSVDGIVQLSDSTGTTSSTLAATPTAVKAAYDLANAALPKAGGVITGALEIGSAGSLVFEGSTNNGNETTITVADPTADRTITFPNVTGNVVTTGDSGTVTSTMIADGTIVDADINASAAIAGTKISPNFGSQNVITTGNLRADRFENSEANEAIILDPSSDSIQFVSNTIERLRIDGSGRLLLGTSAYRPTGDPFYPFGMFYSEGSTTDHYQVLVGVTNRSADPQGPQIALGRSRGSTNGAVTIVENNDTLGEITFAGADGVDLENRAALIRCEVDGTPGADDMPGRLVFSTTADGASSPTERLRIDSSGNVGIGTSSPALKLSVDGDVWFGNGAGAEIGRLFNDSGTLHLRASSNVTGLSLGTNGTERLRIDSSGNVGIGTSSPTATLDVNGDVKLASLNGGPLAGFRNRIINGNFDIWQRGTSFSPADNTYTADRWAVVYDGSGATRTISRETFNPGSTEAAPGATFFLGFNQTVAGSGGTYNSLLQRIEDVRTFAGQTVTLSFYARGLSAALTLPAIGLSQVFGTGGSAVVYNNVASNVVIAGTNFAKYTYTVTLPSIIGKTIGTGSYLSLDFAMPNNATFNFQIGSVQLESGSVATPFEQRPIGTELALCQRYCQRKEFDMRVLATAASANYAFSQHLPVSMRATPTATFISNTSALNTASVFVAPLSIDTIRFTVASSASGDMFRQDLYQLSSEL